MTVEPMTPKALRHLMRKPAVERPLGDPSPGERLALIYVKGSGFHRVRRESRS